MSTSVSKNINALVASHAAKLLENLLNSFYQVDTVEFVAKVQHREVATKSDRMSTDLVKYTSVLTYKDGIIEVINAKVQPDEVTA